MTKMYCPYTYPGYPEGLEYPWIFPMPSEKERDLRWRTIRKAMEREGLDCVIVCTLPVFTPSSNHLFYISNYVPFGAKGVYVIFPLKGEPRLVINNAIGPQFVHFATETAWIEDIVGTLDPPREIVESIKQLHLQDSRLGVVGYEQGLFPGPVYNALRENLKEAVFFDGTSMLGEAMNEVTRRSLEEPLLVKQACEILDFSFQAVAEVLRPGVTECELWAVAEREIIKNGGWPFHGMFVTSGPRPSFPRVPPSHRTLSRGDVVVFEINASYGGVNPQSCFAISLGVPAKDVQEMFAFCEELYQFSLSELEKQTVFMEIELEIGKRIREAGYEPMTPQIHIFNMSVVMPMEDSPKPGDYFTVHPNFADPRYTMGAKLGDAVRISEQGRLERLQKTEARLHIIPV